MYVHINILPFENNAIWKRNTRPLNARVSFWNVAEGPWVNWGQWSLPLGKLKGKGTRHGGWVTSDTLFLLEPCPCALACLSCLHSAAQGHTTGSINPCCRTPCHDWSIARLCLVGCLFLSLLWHNKHQGLPKTKPLTRTYISSTFSLPLL